MLVVLYVYVFVDEQLFFVILFTFTSNVCIVVVDINEKGKFDKNGYLEEGRLQ